MDKNYLQAVERKLKKQGKSEQEVDAYIKNLVNPNQMDENKEEEKVEEVLSAPVEEVGEVTGTEALGDEPTLTGEAEPEEESTV